MEFSNQYLTYTDYKGLGGTLDQMPFNILEFEARKNIDKYTFGRLKDLASQVQEVKLCINRLIGILNSYNTNEAQNKAISSENIDGYSVSYQAVTNDLIKGKSAEIRNIIEEYLADCKLEDGTPYLYRGV